MTSFPVSSFECAINGVNLALGCTQSAQACRLSIKADSFSLFRLSRQLDQLELVYTKSMNTAIETVDDYINQFGGETKARLLTLRKIITSAVPDAEEGIMYGLIGYKLHKKPLIYFGGYAGHIGLYATPTGHEAFKKELAKYKQGKGSVQFPLDEPLPVDLVKRIVVYRREQVEASV